MVGELDQSIGNLSSTGGGQGIAKNLVGANQKPALESQGPGGVNKGRSGVLCCILTGLWTVYTLSVVTVISYSFIFICTQKVWLKGGGGKSGY